MEKTVLLSVIRSYVKKMPSLSTTVSKILEICNDPRTSPTDLNQVISLDPVLMARVMKLINSAYYSLPNRITSLVRAIIMLGINTVKNLALSTAVLSNFGKKSSFQALDMDGFWRHSLCVGVTAKYLASTRNVEKSYLEEYFVAGLLHDLGKIPLNNRLMEDYVEALSLSEAEQCPLYVAEERILEVNHSEVGKIIMESWSLSTDISDTAFYHHAIKEYSGEHQDILYTVTAANFFANAHEIGFSGDRFSEPLPREVFEYLGIDEDFMTTIAGRVNSEIERAKIFLRVV